MKDNKEEQVIQLDVENDLNKLWEDYNKNCDETAKKVDENLREIHYKKMATIAAGANMANIVPHMPGGFLFINCNDDRLENIADSIMCVMNNYKENNIKLEDVNFIMSKDLYSMFSNYFSIQGLMAIELFKNLFRSFSAADFYNNNKEYDFKYDMDMKDTMCLFYTEDSIICENVDTETIVKEISGGYDVETKMSYAIEVLRPEGCAQIKSYKNLTE